MNDSKFSEEVKKNLEAQGISISSSELQELYTSVLGCISEILDNGDIVDISNFGSFWRKKTGTSAATFFKPTEDILTHINTQ